MKLQVETENSEFSTVLFIFGRSGTGAVIFWSERWSGAERGNFHAGAERSGAGENMKWSGAERSGVFHPAPYHWHLCECSFWGMKSEYEKHYYTACTVPTVQFSLCRYPWV